MDDRNQNFFQRQNQGEFIKKQILGTTVSNLKAMSMDPNKKNQVLSSLARIQGQISPNDYNEILANVKSTNHTITFKQEENNYQNTISNLKQLEHETRFKKNA